MVLEFKQQVVMATYISVLEPVNRITFDPATSNVYVGLGCGGIGLVSASQAYNLTNPVVRQPLNTPSTSVVAVPGPGNRLYICLINQGLAVLDDVTSFATSPITVYRTLFQPFDLVTASTDRKKLYLADGRGGVSLLDFTGIL